MSEFLSLRSVVWLGMSRFVAVACVVITASFLPLSEARARLTNTALAAVTIPETPVPHLSGAGTFRWFGLRIYDAQLWVDSDHFDPANPLAGPFALALTYARSLAGDRIASSSTDEIDTLAIATPAQLAIWDSFMKATFPDVVKGDRLVGVVDTAGRTRFLLNDQPIGAIDDPAFARAFFSIWLDERTSAPALRAALLGLSAGHKP